MSSPQRSVREWILKAESDLKVARDELATEQPATDAVCFHSEQCAEKYLKAYLAFCSQEIPRTHNIAELIYRCTEIDEAFQILLETEIPSLTSYAVAMRYPSGDPFPPLQEAHRAVELAEATKTFVLERLAQKGFSLK